MTTLLDLASRGRLHDPATLTQQVRRMMADPRASALVENFAGQWLQLRNIASVTPNERTFPEFDELLRRAFRRETELFVESNLREDRSLLDLLTANYSFVNERLARHYKIPNIYGEQFRRVTFDEGSSARGPARSRQPSHDYVVSDPHVAGPARQVGAREHPGQPATAAAAQRARPARAGRGRKAGIRPRAARAAPEEPCRARRAIHRWTPSGFALENFDGIGKFRTTSEAGGPVDAKGAFPTGPEFVGPARASNVPARPPRDVRRDGHREAPGLRAGPRAGDL